MSTAASPPACDAAGAGEDFAYQSEKWAPELKRFVDELAPAR
jgi:hypothetical protein